MMIIKLRMPTYIVLALSREARHINVAELISSRYGVIVQVAHCRAPARRHIVGEDDKG